MLQQTHHSRVLHVTDRSLQSSSPAWVLDDTPSSWEHKNAETFFLFCPFLSLRFCQGHSFCGWVIPFFPHAWRCASDSSNRKRDVSILNIICGVVRSWFNIALLSEKCTMHIGVQLLIATKNLAHARPFVSKEFCIPACMPL